MRRGLLIALSLLLGANCAARPSAPEATARAVSPQGERAAEAVESPTPMMTPEPVKGEVIPEDFKAVDFANFTYPTFTAGKGVRLKGGSFERPYRHGGGETYELRNVSFADMTGDGKKEAIVELSVVRCGGSCDGGSHEFYVYESGGRKPRLFWRVGSGSLAYGCGLKTLTVRGRHIIIEVFKDCDFDAGAFGSDDRKGKEEAEPIYKFESKEFTRFSFESDGRKVSLKGREVFPYPKGDVMNYRSEISISDE